MTGNKLYFFVISKIGMFCFYQFPIKVPHFLSFWGGYFRSIGINDYF